MKTLVLFGSTTGNTEMLAGAVGEGLLDAECLVKVVDVAAAKPEDMLEHDLIVLGCSTWGEGELQDDFVPFYEGMSQVSLAGKKAAAFGCGDTNWMLFCKAVDLLEERLAQCGAVVVAKGFKVDGPVEDVIDEAKKWASLVGRHANML